MTVVGMKYMIQTGRILAKAPSRETITNTAAGIDVPFDLFENEVDEEGFYRDKLDENGVLWESFRLVDDLAEAEQRAATLFKTFRYVRVLQQVQTVVEGLEF